MDGLGFEPISSPLGPSFGTLLFSYMDSGLSSVSYLLGWAFFLYVSSPLGLSF
jgi:hypothetical protein